MTSALEELKLLKGEFELRFELNGLKIQYWPNVRLSGSLHDSYLNFMSPCCARVTWAMGELGSERDDVICAECSKLTPWVYERAHLDKYWDIRTEANFSAAGLDSLEIVVCREEIRRACENLYEKLSRGEP